MKPEQLHILRHSLGLDDNGHGNCYRNYYATAPDCSGYSDMEALVAGGLMHRNGSIGAYEAFSVTAAGRTAALRDVVYPKLTKGQRRYQAWLSGGSDSFTFGEWLKTQWAKV